VKNQWSLRSNQGIFHDLIPGMSVWNESTVVFSIHFGFVPESMPEPLAVLAIWLFKKVTEKKPLGRSIPSPKGWPIIGNLLPVDVPTEVEYKVFSQWNRYMVS
jgi:hypothetical protein